MEILPPNCGKGEAITWLAKHIGIDPAQTMAFGDSMNDESMIRLCGYGVAMKNGLEEIKNIAKKVQLGEIKVEDINRITGYDVHETLDVKKKNSLEKIFMFLSRSKLPR